jgi:hypothetical protein
MDKSDDPGDKPALVVACALGDGVAQVLSLLDKGRCAAAHGHHAAARLAFDQAAALARSTAAAEHSGNSAPRNPEWQRRWPLSSMVEALREVGLEEAALEVEERAGLKPRRSTSATVSNRADDVHAHNVVQVGVVHGDLHIVSGQGSRDGRFLNVSVETSQCHSTTYVLEGAYVHPDREVRIFVEAFTAQAVLLRRLRPELIRELPEVSECCQVRLTPREFELSVDRPAFAPPVPTRAYDADLQGRFLRLHNPSAGGGFPFTVTASDPEYFVIRPEHHAGSRKAPVEWQLELDWSCLGQHGTVTISHSHRPFLSDS